MQTRTQTESQRAPDRVNVAISRRVHEALTATAERDGYILRQLVDRFVTDGLNRLPGPQGPSAA